MTPQEQEFRAILLELAADAGLALSETQAGLCTAHILIMLEWNRRLNLTRITDLREIAIKHVLDSLLPAQWLPESGRALDVGTGPGFPGIPLKILHPELDMVLLEAHRKKVSFLKVLISQLALENLRALQGRWEDFRRIDHPLASGHYRLATMRAVRLEPEHLTLHAPQVLEPGGVFAWWAGPGTADDLEVERLIDRCKPSHLEMDFDGSFTYTLPTLSRPRRLLLWKKRDPASQW